MRAFLSILQWEIKYSLRRVSTWVYFLIFFTIAFFFILVVGGAFFDLGIALGSGGKVAANAPFVLASLIPAFSLFGISITAALAGNALYRDYETGAHPLFYTTPVSKPAFLGGRFAGAVAVNSIVMVGIAAGALLATVSPWVKADRIAAFHASWYAVPYLELVLPNLLLTA